jgi:hypothetical protein
MARKLSPAHRKAISKGLKKYHGGKPHKSFTLYDNRGHHIAMQLTKGFKSPQSYNHGDGRIKVSVHPSNISKFKSRLKKQKIMYNNF